MATDYKIWDFPAIAVQSQLFHVPGMSFDGGWTSGGARMNSPEPGGRSVLELQLAMQTKEWEIPFASWLASKANGEIFRIQLTKTPQLVPNIALGSSGGNHGRGGIPWANTYTGENSPSHLRDSIGTYFDVAGVLQTAAINVPRYDFDMVTHAPNGLFVEPAATNRIRNNTMQGFVAGSPGTLPNFWIMTGTPVGLTRTLFGPFVENGIECFDIQFQGVPSTFGVGLGMTPDGNYVDVIGETWANSAFMKLISGSFANFSSGALLLRAGGQAGGLTFTPDATMRRYTNIRTLDATNGAFTLRWSFLNAVTPVDVRWRIGLPQNELDVVTSVIKTSGTRLRRAGDLVPTNGIPFSQTWDNGQLWRDDGYSELLADDALEGSNTLLIDMSTYGRVLKHGHVFGHGDYSYIVDDIEYDGTFATVTIKPPLRKTIDAGELIYFRPYFLGSIANGEQIRAAYEASDVGHNQMGKIIFNEVVI